MQNVSMNHVRTTQLTDTLLRLLAKPKTVGWLNWIYRRMVRLGRLAAFLADNGGR